MQEQPQFHAFTGAASPIFANDAELECAQILDFHGIPWDYEPHTFTLEVDDQGNTVEAFTPDFYLPEQDLYLECAQILDFHGIPWDYEPHTFTLEVDDQGNTVEAFTPDFYLPEQDLYLEITTMKQSLVTKKNRKMRRLRELRPDIRIKLFYKRDVEALAEKYELRDAS